VRPPGKTCYQNPRRCCHTIALLHHPDHSHLTKPPTSIDLFNMPAGKRIVFTGGSGKAGRHVIPELQKKGHQVLNLDLIDFPDPAAGVFTLKTDLTDSGQCFNALTTHFNFAGYEGPNVPGPPDVVVHFAAYARNMLVPDNECYSGNVRSTYNVIEAACKLGVKKVRFFRVQCAALRCFYRHCHAICTALDIVLHL